MEFCLHDIFDYVYLYVRKTSAWYVVLSAVPARNNCAGVNFLPKNIHVISRTVSCPAADICWKRKEVIMSAISAIRKYDQFLLGNSKFTLKGPYDIDSAVRPEEKTDSDDELDRLLYEKKKNDFMEKTARAKEEDALAVVRYAITDLLRWTPEEAMNLLTPDIIEKLRFDRVAKYVIYPADINRSDDKKEGYPWMIHRAFPNDTKYDMREQLLKVYEQVRSGKLDQFPRYMFRGEDRDKKLAILLSDYLAKHVPSSSVEDLYRLFANPTDGNRILRRAKLFYAYKKFYESPLLYLHLSLGDEADNFYFNFYQYMEAVRIVSERRSASAGQE